MLVEFNKKKKRKSELQSDVHWKCHNSNIGLLPKSWEKTSDSKKWEGRISMTSLGATEEAMNWLIQILPLRKYYIYQVYDNGQTEG